MTYVDGYVLPLPKDRIEDYRLMAQKAGDIWMEYGALSYKECVGDDLYPEHFTTTFPSLIGMQAEETIVFAFILFESREHRDSVNEKVMADPRMQEFCNAQAAIPFDIKRMNYGGFRAIVDL